MTSEASPATPSLLDATDKMRAGLEKALDAGPIALIDLGGAKAVWMIVQKDGALAKDGIGLDLRASGALKTLASGEAPSAGMRLGAIDDLSAATRTLEAARDAAEGLLETQKITRTVKRVSADGAALEARVGVALLGAGGARGAMTSGETALPKRRVRDEDLAAAMGACRAPSDEDGRMALHAEPARWRIDGDASAHDPRGRSGRRLSVDLQVVSVAEDAVRDLDLCADRAGATLHAVAAAPLATGLGAATPQERGDGVAVLDLGASAVSLSVFKEGRPVFIDALRLGGARATDDLMRAFGLGRAEAERLKHLHGSVEIGVVAGSGSGSGGGKPGAADVARVLRARYEEVFELCRDRVAQSGFYGFESRRLVLSGGAAAARGLAGLAGAVFGAETRIAAPTPPPGAPAHFCAPAYAGVVGLAAFVAARDPAAHAATAARAAAKKKPLWGPSWLAKGVAKWARESW